MTRDPALIPAPAGAEDLPARFRSAWRALDCPAYWRRLLVAVSGGPDSLALLHLLHETRHLHRLELVVAHVDHGIHPDSGAVAAAVTAAADRLGLPSVRTRLSLGAGASETTARQRRHAWLEEVRAAQSADAIALGHHRGDQVETTLMRVLAGSGPAGLAGMAPRRGRILHPLLGFTKPELEEWLAGRGIAFWDDPANHDVSHLRSWVRGDLLPLLRGTLPDVDAHLLRLGRLAAQEREAWDRVLSLLPALDLRAADDRISVAALPLVTYDSALASTLLRAAARQAGCVLGHLGAGRLLAVARRGRSGRLVELGAGWSGELAFGRIGIFRVVESPAPVVLDGPEGTMRWGPWRVSWRRGPAGPSGRRDGWVGWFIGEGPVLRGPRRGDRMLPLGGAGRRPVARLLQEAKVERNRRSAWPVLEVEGRVVWVAGVCRSGWDVPEEGDEATRIEVTDG